MTHQDEKLLSGYLDGALSEDDSRRVDAMIAKDPSLAEELERLRGNDRLLSAAIRSEIPDEVDAATLRHFGLAEPVAPAAERSAANDNVRRWVWPAVGAIAAAAALFLVVQPRTANQPWQSQAFSDAMEANPSLVEAALPNGQRVAPVLTFVAGDGRFCREFRLSGSQPAQGREGIACRAASDKWEAVAVAGKTESLPATDKINVAEGADTSGLDAAYQKLGASDPLPAAEERKVIAAHWASKNNRSPAE